MAGVGPALKLSRLDIVNDLKEQADSGTRPGRFTARNVLVVAQLALSLGLLSMGGLFARSAFNAANSDPGFTYERAILAALDPSVAQMNEARGREIYRMVLERIRSTPGIEAAALPPRFLSASSTKAAGRSPRREHKTPRTGRPTA